jgi:DNA polymerase-3 subunit epsilon
MKLSEAITATIDIESTGVNTETDRIITLSVVRSDMLSVRECQCNPGIPIPPGATEVHHITDDMVKDWKPFRDQAADFVTFLQGVNALIGFNIYGFDLLMIMAELARAGVTAPFPEPGVVIIDSGTIFHKKEPRTLEAAVQKYCNRKHENAHGATSDALATLDVLHGQLAAYPDLQEMDLTQLATFSQQKGMVDYAGKLGRDAQGEVIYRIGAKTRGVRVKDDIGMAEWMLARDFPKQTKQILLGIITEKL